MALRVRRRRRTASFLTITPQTVVGMVGPIALWKADPTRRAATYCFDKTSADPGMTCGGDDSMGSVVSVQFLLSAFGLPYLIGDRYWGASGGSLQNFAANHNASIGDRDRYFKIGYNVADFPDFHMISVYAEYLV